MAICDSQTKAWRKRKGKQIQEAREELFGGTGSYELGQSPAEEGAGSYSRSLKAVVGNEQLHNHLRV